jgi:cytochrome c
MKKIILGIACISFILLSFTEKNEKETITTLTKSSIEKGKKLFNSNTCNACHQEQIKVVGPALKDIAAKYKAKKGNIVNFLQGKSKSIVDTDPGQTAIMQASLSITKAMKVEDLKAISEYILSIK